MLSRIGAWAASLFSTTSNPLDGATDEQRAAAGKTASVLLRPIGRRPRHVSRQVARTLLDRVRAEGRTVEEALACVVDAYAVALEGRAAALIQAKIHHKRSEDYQGQLARAADSRARLIAALETLGYRRVGDTLVLGDTLVPLSAQDDQVAFDDPEVQGHLAAEE